MKNEAFKNALRQQYKAGYKKGFTNGTCNTVKNYSAITLLCLKDHFDFNNDQLKEIAGHINNYFDSVCKGLVSFDDVTGALKEENNLTVTFDGVVEEV